MTDPKLRALAEAALKIGRERRDLLLQMRAALLREDTPAVIDCARKLTGLDQKDEEVNRPDSRFN
jgi:hypothetical protein